MTLKDGDRRPSLGPKDLGLPQDAGAPAEPAAPADPNVDPLAEFNALLARAGLDPITDLDTIRITPEPEDFMTNEPKTLRGFSRAPQTGLISKNPYRITDYDQEQKYITNFPEEKRREYDSFDSRRNHPLGEPLISESLPHDWALPPGGGPFGVRTPVQEDVYTIGGIGELKEREFPFYGGADQRALREALEADRDALRQAGYPEHLLATDAEVAAYLGYQADLAADAGRFEMPPDFDLPDPMRGWPMKPGAGRGIVNDELKRMVAEERGVDQQGREDSTRAKVYRDSVSLPKAKSSRNEPR